MEFPSTCRKLLQSFSKASPGASQNLLRVSPGAFTRSPLGILQGVLMAVPICQLPHSQNLNGTICTIARTSMEPHIGLPLKSSCNPPCGNYHVNPHEVLHGSLHGSLQGNSSQHTESCFKASSELSHEVFMQLPHGGS